MGGELTVRPPPSGLRAAPTGPSHKRSETEEQILRNLAPEAADWGALASCQGPRRPWQAAAGAVPRVPPADRAAPYPLRPLARAKCNASPCPAPGRQQEAGFPARAEAEL